MEVRATLGQRHYTVLGPSSPEDNRYGYRPQFPSFEDSSQIDLAPTDFGRDRQGRASKVGAANEAPRGQLV